MPPFRTEVTERHPTHHRAPKIIYTKNAYCERVKVEHWQELLEHHPIDADPFCPGKVNYFLSHYNRLGTSDDKSYSTTTADMLEQRFIKSKMTPNKLLGNFYTYYYDEDDCVPPRKENRCPSLGTNPFVTTMQHSFQTPTPYLMQRLAFPKVPFMQNRKIRHELADLSSEKFYSENFHSVTCLLRKHKGFRSTSFNPMTGEYTKASCE